MRSKGQGSREVRVSRGRVVEGRDLEAGQGMNGIVGMLGGNLKDLIIILISCDTFFCRHRTLTNFSFIRCRKM